jgi:hypothetical protein
MAIVEAFKRIRAHGHIEEPKVCFKCEHRTICPVAGKLPREMTNTAVQDIFTFYERLNSLPESSTTWRIWNSAYKSADLMGLIVDDLRDGGS